MDRATKRAVKAAIAASATLVFVWLCGAFACWDFNPGNWAADSRFMTMGLGVVFAVFAAVCVGGPND